MSDIHLETTCIKFEYRTSIFCFHHWFTLVNHILPIFPWLNLSFPAHTRPCSFRLKSDISPHVCVCAQFPVTPTHNEMTSSVCNPLVLIEVHESTLIVDCFILIGRTATPRILWPSPRPFYLSQIIFLPLGKSCGDAVMF